MPDGELIRPTSKLALKCNMSSHNVATMYPLHLRLLMRVEAKNKDQGKIHFPVQILCRVRMACSRVAVVAALIIGMRVLP